MPLAFTQEDFLVISENGLHCHICSDMWNIIYNIVEN